MSKWIGEEALRCVPCRGKAFTLPARICKAEDAHSNKKHARYARASFFFLLVLACLFAGTPLRADEDTDRTEIVRRARAMIDSTFKGDMTAVLAFMHPVLVKLAGEEALKKGIGAVADQMKQLGLEFVSMDVRPPDSFHRAGPAAFAVVKTTTIMQIPAKLRVTEEGSMIAVRDSAEAPWTFVRVNAQFVNDRTLLKKLFPDFPDEISLEPPATRGEPLSPR